MDLIGQPSPDLASYQDFLTGFVIAGLALRDRPVGQAVTRGRSLLVSEDVTGTIWRNAYRSAR
jgi:hypothetical protein